MMRESLLRGESIQFRFSQGSPFQFAVPPGGLTALLGANGSGKSTLLRACLGERVLFQGHIYYQGETRALSAAPLATFRDRISILPQEAPYPHDIRVEDYLRLSMLFVNRDARSRAEEGLRKWSERLQLQALLHRPMRSLSSGERQRAFLTRAILKPCELLLLDEPTNHLDPLAVMQIWETLAEIKHELPGGVVLSTHDLRFARKYADWIVALKQGRLIYCGPSDAFFARYVEDTFGVGAERLFG